MNNMLYLTIFLGVMTAMAPLSTDMYLPSLPEISSAFDISTSMTQLTLTMTMVGMAVGQILGGPVSDRLGRSEAIHHHEECHELHQRRPFHHITRHRASDHDAKSPREPLQETECQEEMDLLRPRTAQRCQRETHHADEERHLAPQPVRDRPAQDLSDRHPHHRHRERVT